MGKWPYRARKNPLPGVQCSPNLSLSAETSPIHAPWLLRPMKGTRRDDLLPCRCVATRMEKLERNLPAQASLVPCRQLTWLLPRCPKVRKIPLRSAQRQRRLHRPMLDKQWSPNERTGNLPVHLPPSRKEHLSLVSFPI